jgi:hypothetical protein
MRQSNWSPSVVPSDDRSVYLVVDDFGRHRRCWRETDVEGTDFETIVTDLLDGQYNNPVRGDELLGDRGRQDTFAFAGLGDTVASLNGSSG